MAKEKLTPETTDEIQATDAVEIQTEDREPVAPRTQTVVKKKWYWIKFIGYSHCTWRGWCRLLFWPTAGG